MHDSFETLDSMAREAGLPEGWAKTVGAPAVRLVHADGEDLAGGSRLGGLPDLPAGMEWPHWDMGAYDERELELAREKSDRYQNEYWAETVQRLVARGSRDPIPLSFLAQLNLADLAGLSHGLPLPADGHLWFFYELTESPWGFDPVDRGGFRVLFAPAGSQLQRRDRPDGLGDEYMFDSTPVVMRETWTVPTWWEATEENEEAFERFTTLKEELYDPPLHQVGGHPDQIQGEMPYRNELVSMGYYIGRPPDLSDAVKSRAIEGARQWRLLLQLCSDDDLDWMWGDSGNLFWWMRQSDIAAGAWDQAWFHLQCC